MRTPLLFAASILALSIPAIAQQTPPDALRGTIERIALDRESLDVKTRDGERLLELPRDAKVSRAVLAKLADVKPGAFVSIAAAAGDDGALKAVEVRIFSESARAGDGFRSSELAPGGAMASGAVNGRVERVDGAQIVVAYEGGERSITVDKSTAIVAIEPGGLGDLMTGYAIVARGGAGEGGSYKASRIVVGVDGVMPHI